MLLNTPFRDPDRYLIPVLDAISSHKLPHSFYVPTLYKQKINITQDMYPERPESRSQIYRRLNPPVDMPWKGGVPIGRIIKNQNEENYKLIAKKFNVQVYKLEYNPPLHLTFK